MIGSPPSPAVQRYGRGLEGLIAGSTAISDIDGERGHLSYRGYPVGELAEAATFEEVSHLVLFGELPDAPALSDWRAELASWRQPPRAAFDALRGLPVHAHPLAQYRTMLTVAACHIPEPDSTGLDAQRRRPARILSWTAALAAAAIRHLDGLADVPPREDLGYSANFLYQALGRVPQADEVRAFDASLIVQAEHGLHAAALAALAVISTGADLGSAVLAGMGALTGVRHGGANQLAFEMLAALDGPQAARRWARQALSEGRRFPGFGHRVSAQIGLAVTHQNHRRIPGHLCQHGIQGNDPGAHGRLTAKNLLFGFDAIQRLGHRCAVVEPRPGDFLHGRKQFQRCFQNSFFRISSHNHPPL